MNNKVVIGVVVALVLAIGGFFAYQAMNSDSAEPAGMMAGDGMMKNSLTSLLGAGQNVTCTFNQDVAGSAQQGNVYIAGNRMRGDFMMHDATAGNYQMHMVRDSEYQYIWGGPMGAAQGMKIKISDVDVSGNTNAQAQTQNFDLNQQLDYNCSPWGVDERLLTPPSDVTFQDLSAMMGAGAEGRMMANTNLDPSSDTPGGDLPPNPNCSVCDQAPAGDARDQCRTALGC